MHEFKPRDLTGKVVIITGASSGIGFQTAVQLSRLHAFIIITCRTKQQGEGVISKIKSIIPNAKLDQIPMDLNSFESVREFVKQFKEKKITTSYTY